MEQQHSAPPAPPTSPPKPRKPPEHGATFEQLIRPSLTEGPAKADGSDGRQDGEHYHHESVPRWSSADTSKSPPSPKKMPPKEDAIPPFVVQRIAQVTIDNDHDVQNLIREYSKDSSLTQSVKTRIHQLIHSVRYRRRRDREAEQRRKELEKEGLEISHSPVVDPDTGKYMLGCQHYPRACKLKAACCNIWVVCRQCHDRDEMGHTMPRHDTKQVMCMRCGMIQPVSRTCIHCREEFARYFCDICKFYDNTPNKSIYHCPECKICRVGRDDDNFHCPRCDACVSNDYAENHRCLKKSLDANCPICGQYLYTSTQPVVFMRCGHTMHSHCFDAYTAENFICPLCHKTLTNMKPYYQQIDAELKRHKMPDEHDDMLSEILCHDCDQRSVTKYHYVYHKCGNENCGSYNTRQLRFFRKGEGSSNDVTHRGESSGPDPSDPAMDTVLPERNSESESEQKEERNVEMEVVPVIQGDNELVDGT